MGFLLATNGTITRPYFLPGWETKGRKRGTATTTTTATAVTTTTTTTES